MFLVTFLDIELTLVDPFLLVSFLNYKSLFFNEELKTYSI